MKTTWRIRTRKRRQNYPAKIAAWWLETVCEMSGHYCACLLLNSRGGGRFGKAWHRIVGAIFSAADDMTEWRPL